MPITFTCPHCGAKSDVADSFAGQQGPCGSCGQTITIPAGGYGAVAPQKKSFPVWLIVLSVVGGVVMALFCIVGILAALLFPAIQAAREAANRSVCLNNVKNITLAMQQYNDVCGTFPPAYIPDDQGKPMHSWRVLILPYLEEQALYEQYDFDQPWDSPHNLDLFRDVNLFPCPSGETPLGHTSYMVVTGPGTMFEGSQSTSMSSVTDGLFNTLMIIEIPYSGVQWSEPVDISAVDLIAKFSDGSIGSESDHAHGVSSGFADGSTRFLRDDISSETLEAYTTKSGDEVVQFDDY